ncbi:MAG: hypothetical protein ACM3SQ_02895 [Betaproteobacteria bacterium]
MIACARRTRPGNRIGGLALAVVALATFAGAGPAAAQVVYSGSVQTTTGRYIFAERTTSIFVLTGLDVAAGPVRISATIPFITQSTPWIAYSPVLIPSGGAESAQVGDQIRRGKGAGAGGRNVVVVLPADVARQTGFGDPVFRVGADLFGSRSATKVVVSGTMKAPLTDPTTGFGTGEWDYGAAVAVSRQQGPHQVFGTVEAWRFGDMPDLVIKDGLGYRVGYEGFVRSDRWSVLAAVSGWTTVLDGVDPPFSVEIGLTRHLGMSGRSVGLIASFGVTEMSPDFSLSLGWRLPFQ